MHIFTQHDLEIGNRYALSLPVEQVLQNQQ